MKHMDMLHGSLWDKLLQFAFPLALTGCLQQMYNTADVAVVGRFLGTQAVAAVGTNISIIGLVVSLFLGISLGANVMVSRYIGSGESEKARRCVHTAILLAFWAGLFILLLGQFFAHPLLRALAVPEDDIGMAETYLRIYFCGMPILAIFNFESAIFRSRGDTGTPLEALLLASILNAGLDVVFTGAFGWGVAGVALATVFAQMTAAGYLFRRLLRAGGVIQIELSRIRADRPLLKEILQSGLPAGVQGMVFSFANIVIQSSINSLGAETMAASGAAFAIEINVYCVVYAFSQAVTTFVSQNYGAGKLERCRRATWLSFWINAVCMGILTVCVLAFGPFLMSLFDPNPEVIRMGMIRMWYVVLPEILNAIIDIFSGALRGYGFSAQPAALALIGICGVRLTWVATVFQRYPSFETLMACYPLSWAVTAVFICAAYWFFTRNLKAYQKSRA